MGQRYAYVFWVEREKLYDFLMVFGRDYDNPHGISKLRYFVWPDGRRLPDFGNKSPNPAVQSYPVFWRGERNLCLSLPFPPDDVLLGYKKLALEMFSPQLPKKSVVRKSSALLLLEDWERRLRIKTENTSSRREANKKRFTIGCIYFDIFPVYDWREGEDLMMRVEYRAAASPISHVFWESKSIRQTFLSLAVEGGAVAAFLDYEGSGDELIWLDGKTQDFRHEALDADMHPRLWRRRLQEGEPGNEFWEQEVQRYQELPIPTQHEWMEMLLASAHPDPGVRAWMAGYFWELYLQEFAPAGKRVWEMAGDNDWRVRAALAYRFRETYQPIPSEVRLALVNDSHPEVRGLSQKIG